MRASWRGGRRLRGSVWTGKATGGRLGAMNDPEDDLDPPPSRYGLMVAALGMLAGFIFIWSFLRGWRPF